MILYPHETVVVQGGAGMHSGAGVVYGTLTVTTHRLVFEAGGVAPYTVMDFGIEKVWNVHQGHVPGGLLRAPQEFLTIESTHGRVVFQTVNVRAWAEAIIRVRGAQPPVPPPPPPPPMHDQPGQGGPVVINVAAPPPPKVMLTCRYCGNLYDAAGGRCDKCGGRP